MASWVAPTKESEKKKKTELKEQEERKEQATCFSESKNELLNQKEKNCN